MQYVKDIRLTSRGKLTLEPDCSAVDSSFTLLSRDTRKSELYAHPQYPLLDTK